MKLLIINPNTTEAMTAKVEVVVRAQLSSGVEIKAVSGSFGPRYISSRSAFAVASHAALDAFAEHGGGADVVLLACFGDPGLDALREVAGVPVVGLVEASARAASEGGRRFSIVTGGVLWEPMLRESLKLRGLDGGLASIRTVAPDGGMIARDPDGALAVLAGACDACVGEDGAQAVILGGVGLVGLAGRIQPGRGYPVICSVQAGLEATAHALRDPSAGLAREERMAAVESIRLSPALEALLLKRMA